VSFVLAQASAEAPPQEEAKMLASVFSCAPAGLIGLDRAVVQVQVDLNTKALPAVTRRNLTLLAFPPLLVAALIVTNDLHSWA
jgi:hypothetical protein